MRTEYVIPLTAKLAAHAAKLEQDKDASSTTAEIKRLEKEISRLHKKKPNSAPSMKNYATLPTNASSSTSMTVSK